MRHTVDLTGSYLALPVVGVQKVVVGNSLDGRQREGEKGFAKGQGEGGFALPISVIPLPFLAPVIQASGERRTEQGNNTKETPHSSMP